MQMFPSAAPGIACNPDNITRQNVLPLWYGDLRQVTITDGKATVLDSNIFPGHLILSNSKDSPLHHGKYLGTSGMEVNTIVKLPLPREWVFPITVRRIYLDMWERIAYAEIASYLLFLFLCQYLTMKPCRVRTFHLQRWCFRVSPLLCLSSGWDFQQWLYSDCPERKPCWTALSHGSRIITKEGL